MSLDRCGVLFTDETKAILDEHEFWTNDWVYFKDESHQRLRRNNTELKRYVFGWYY